MGLIENLSCIEICWSMGKIKLFDDWDFFC